MLVDEYKLEFGNQLFQIINDVENFDTSLDEIVGSTGEFAGKKVV